MTSGTSLVPTNVNNAMNDILPYRFVQPSDAAMNVIVDELQKLPINSEREILSSLTGSRRKQSRKANLDELRSILANALDLDFADLLAEAKDAPYSFEYVIEKWCADEGNFRHQGLSIMTRLFAPQRSSGSIYYGWTVFRIGDDHFLWLE